MSAQAMNVALSELHMPVAATADVCDANPDARVLLARFRRFGGMERCAGHVEIVSTKDDNSLVKEVLKECGNGRVLLIDAEGSIDCAMLGGNLAELAAKKGWAGIIVNGAVRDTNEFEESSIAVYALATCPRRSVNRGRGSRNRSVRVGGEKICAGDFLVADADGVVVISS
jgi:regulator of ribonuclease activity A